MRYRKVHLDALGYELAPVVVTSAELEERLAPVYAKLRIDRGQMEALTGIAERRWWEPGYSLAEGAAAAARRALERAAVPARSLEVLIYAGVCRESFEPATACHVAERIGVHPNAAVYDLSNACLGVLNGILDIANRIELGQIRAGMVVAAETAREIIEVTIERMLALADMETFVRCLATMTGGSGAAAVLVTDGSFPSGERHRLLGGIARTAPEYHHLCRWGLGDAVHLHGLEPLPQEMNTDSVAVMKHGVELGRRTWEDFLRELELRAEDVDRVICHQVGAPHRTTILDVLKLPERKDFSTFPHLGNMGTVSLPLTAALAAEREFLARGDCVGFLGIGSGLNCLILGFEW